MAFHTKLLLQSVTDEFRRDLLDGTSVTLSYDSYKSRYLKSILSKYFDLLKVRLPKPGLTVLNLMDFGYEDFGVFGRQLSDYIERARLVLDDETRRNYQELLEKYLEFIPEDLRNLRMKLLEIYDEMKENAGKKPIKSPIDDYRMVTYQEIDSRKLKEAIQQLPDVAQQIDYFIKEIALSGEAQNGINRVIDYLSESLLNSELSELRPKVHLFGSLSNHLACYDCDLDLVIKFEAFDSIDLLDYETSWLALKVIQLVWEQKLCLNLKYDRALVPSRRCPLVILDFKQCLPDIANQVARLNQMNVNQIVFNKANVSIRCLYGYYNSKLIECFAKHDQRFREMNLLLKYWVKRVVGLIGKDNICSYALTLLIVFFLQNCQPQVLPPIELLQKQPQIEPIKVNLYNFEFCDNFDQLVGFDKSTNTKSTVELIIEFMHFYSNFNYDFYAICPRTGKNLSKVELNRNICDVAQPTDINSLFRKSNITIQDPFVDTNNVGLNFQLQQTNRWKMALKEMVNCVTVDNCVRLLSGQEPPRAINYPNERYGRRRYY